jgi:hypothetical protein
VEKKAADELVGRQRHWLNPSFSWVLAVGAIVFPAEGDAPIIERDEPRVRDGDTEGVAGEIGEDGLRSRERPHGVDHPFRAAQRREGGGEGGLVGERRKIAEEGEAAVRIWSRKLIRPREALVQGTANLIEGFAESIANAGRACSPY